MKISIKRDKKHIDYKVQEMLTLLHALEEIKQTQDATLCFSSGCRSNVCGSCAVRVNGKEVLACSHKIQDGDVVEPLKNVDVIRDLVVDMEKPHNTNKKAKAYISQKNITKITNDDEKLNELQSDCILCGSCYSVCPVFSVNGDFLGPFSLTRVWKYVSDVRETNTKEKIDVIQKNGVWDCTLCNECTLVCPQNISPKQDIEKLRMKSAQFGYMDPNFASFDGGLTF